MQNASPAAPNFGTSQNFDAAELSKFGDLAHKWWDLQGEFAPLHGMNPLRLAWIDGIAPLSGQRVVDVGCGGGILAESMAQRGAHTLGIDLAEKSLRVAQLHALEQVHAGTLAANTLHYRAIACEALAAEQPAAYDVVTCMELLEHVPDPAQVVQACAQLVKPGGWVFVSTLNRTPKSFLHGILGAEYLLGLVPRGTHDYKKFIQPSELAHFARAAGLTLRRSTGMGYNPLTRRFWLTQDLGVNFALAFQKV